MVNGSTSPDQGGQAEAVDPAFGRNIRRIYAYQVLTNVSLWMPIWIVFLHNDRHLSLGQILLIAGVGWIMQAAADVPLGVFADAFGRKVTVLTGTCVLTVGLALLAVLPGFYGVAAGYLFWAIGTAMMSGTDTALLYESARLAGREEDFPKIASHSFQLIQGAQAAGSIGGSLLASLGLGLPMLVTAGLSGVAAIALAGTREPPAEHDRRPGYTEVVRSATRYLGGHPPVLALVVYAAMIGGTAFFVPFVLFQPEMQSQTVALGWFGLLFTGLRLASLAGSRYGYKLITDSSLGSWLAAVPAVMVVLFLVVAGSRTWWLAYLAMLAIAVANASVRPHLSAILNRLVTSKIRATLLSFQNLSMTVFIAVMHPAVGVMTDTWGLRWAFVLLAGLSLLPFVARAFMDVKAPAAAPAAAPAEAEAVSTTEAS
ncbi:MAG TPA: MFS transporter [Trebonia sp.]|nr:MFS transporter [Trebonia sp.]